MYLKQKFCERRCKSTLRGPPGKDRIASVLLTPASLFSACHRRIALAAYLELPTVLDIDRILFFPERIFANQSADLRLVSSVTSYLRLPQDIVHCV